MHDVAPDHWERTTLGTLVERGGGSIQTGPFGSQLHAADYVPVGIPSIMPVNIGDNRLIRDGIACITPADAQRLSKHIVRKGDIIYSRRGDVERRAIVRDAEDGWFCGTGCLKVRLGDGVIVPEFATYYLGHPEVRAWIVRHAVGATMPNLNTGIMQAIPFLLPPWEEQRAIASVLGSLDDKIELNRRMNRTLEQMAAAIFKAWFVDFEPVRAKASGAASFLGMPQPVFDALPATFVDSELGPIPEGWEVARPEQYFEFVLGGDWGKDNATDDWTEQTRCIRGADIPSIQAGGIGSMPTRFLKPNSLAKRRLRAGDLAFEISGGSPTQSTGRPVLITESLERQIGMPIVCSNFCRLIRSSSVANPLFVYSWLLDLYRRDEFLQYENGTTGIKNLAFKEFAANHPVIRPEADVMAAFGAAVSGLWELHGLNGIESATLAETRDTLLPKLLSGEVRIPLMAEAY